MTQEKYDVVIVGAGLAGFAAADEAVDNNLKTLLVEKGKTTRSEERRVGNECK